MTAPRPIFLHGAIAGSSCWGSLSDQFEGAAVLGLPGHPTGDAISDVSELVDWIALAITQLDGSRVVVGHGLGALLALETARRHPDVLAGVVALGVAARLRVPQVAGTTHDDTVSDLLAASLHKPEGDVGEALAQAMQALGAEALATDLAMAARLEIGTRAREIRCPILVVVGEHDVWAPPRDAAELAGALPNSHMIVVAQAGHLVHADAPATTQLLIAAFLARLGLTLGDE
jgi:pimeloyl-ACP methyl ester carboxylesterase